MASDLVVLEQQLQPLAPHFLQVLPAHVTPERLIRTVIMSVERNPKLLGCNRQSLFNSAMSAAVLGLEVDGVTGQAFLIPFKNRAQLVIGYKGYNTMGARSGWTIAGDVVRDGDEFKYEKGSAPFVKHVPVLGNKGRIIGAWATATHLAQPPVVEVMGIDELLEVKKRAPGAKMSDSPWNEPAIGFPAMCSKTVKRRLARSMPLNVMQRAATMEQAVEEQGRNAWIAPNGDTIIDAEIVPSDTQSTSETPTADELTTPAEESIEDLARKAAKQGEAFFKVFYKCRSPEEKVKVDAIGAELREILTKNSS